MNHNIGEFSKVGFYLSIVGLSLAAVSMYDTLGTGNGMLFIIGLLLCSLSIEILLIKNYLKGARRLKNGITFGFICIVAVGLVLMIISLMDVMSTTNLFLFSVGIALILNPFIRILAKKDNK
ncbi:hypothetical protein [Paenibacillus amylolyticus]|uniref:hypothetical protein n=1 Tax=Paenibacillus amylolyticus TaxID=1451 RepID=UPI003EBDCE0C